MSLSADGFTNLGTLKVPSLGVGVTSSNTPLLIKAADLTTAMIADLKGDWGDLRLSTDAAGNNQLPLDIADTDLAWTRLTSVAADDVIYIWGNDPSATQPAVGAAFGRNAVWVDFELVIHQGFIIDSTGNHSPSLTGSPSLATMMWGGQGYDFQTTGQYISVPHSTSLDSGKDYSVDVWSNATAGAGAQFYLDKSNFNTDGFRFFKSNVGNQRSRHPDLSGANLDSTGASGLLRESSTFDGTTRSNWRSGVVLDSDTPTGTVLPTTTDLIIANNEDFDRPLGGVLGELWFAIPARTTSRSIEESNQSAAGAWWIAEDAGGAITVTGATANYSYAAINGAVDLTPLLTITGQTPNYAYSPISGSIELTPQISVTGQTPNYNYAAIAGSVQTVGIINITGATANYNYNAIDADVALQGTISITGQTVNYSYGAISGTVTDGITIYTNIFIGVIAQNQPFNGVVKSATFSGIIKDIQDFSGYVKSSTFSGVKK